MSRRSRFPLRRTAGRSALSMASLLIAACTQVDVPTGTDATELNVLTADARGSTCPKLPGGITSIRLSPAVVAALPGSSGTFSVVDQRGRELPACAFSWSSTAPGTASVERGLTTIPSGATGSATIRARLSAKVTLEASASVTADPAANVDSIVVSPAPMILVVSGATTQFTARGIDFAGRTIWGYTTSWQPAYTFPDNPEWRNMTVSSTGLMSTTAGRGGTNYVQVSMGSAFNQTKVAINPGSNQVLCYDNVWSGWAVYGDCTQPEHPVGTAKVMRFRVVDGLNRDLAGATMWFEVDPSKNVGGSVSPASLAAPNVGAEFVTSWTLGSQVGENVLYAYSNVGGVGVHVQGR